MRLFARWSFLVALTALPAVGQQIYSKTKDDQAQAALDAMKSIASGSLYEKELRNFELFSRQSMDTFFLGKRTQIRTDLLGLTTWRDACDLVERIKTTIGAQDMEGCTTAAKEPTDDSNRRQQLTQRALADVEAQAAQLTAAVKRLQAMVGAPEDSAVAKVLAHAGDVADALDLARRLGGAEFAKVPDTAEAIDQLSQSLIQVTALYNAYASAMGANQKVREDLALLRYSPERLELELLKADEEHLKFNAAILARRQTEIARVRRLLKNCVLLLKRNGVAGSTAEIEETLRGSDQKTLNGLLLALYELAALVGHGETPGILAQQRADEEEHRYSIRRSATVSRDYELLLSQSVQRLALYYRGGLKPDQIAQLIYNITNTVAIPAIAAK